MIGQTLEYLREKLKKKLGSGQGDPEVMITQLTNENKQDGKIVLMLVNVEEERILKAQLPREKRTGDQVQFLNPEIKLNLLVVMAAPPGDYETSLNNLARAMTYFQGNAFYDRKKLNDKLIGIDQLSIEMVTLSFEQQNQLWASLSTRYVPSVVYKIRLVIIADNEPGENKSLIRGIDNELKRIN